MTYDGFDFEAAICDIFPGHGAIMGGMANQTRNDFEKYPWKEIRRSLRKVYLHLRQSGSYLPA
jgi:hypothetical protein